MRRAGRIVDAVAQEADHVPLALQGADDPLLVGGREPGEEGRALGGLGQLGVGHGLDLRAQEHAIGGQPDLVADLAADQLVVAGEHLHRHAVVLQRQDRGGGRLLGRIEEGDVALEHQLALVVLRVGRPPLEVPVGDRQHAEAVGAQLVVLLLEFRDQQRVDGIDLPVQLEGAAALEDRLRRALADQAMSARRGLDDDRHQLAREIEGDLVDLLEVGRRELAVHRPAIEDRAVQDVLQPGLEVAVEVGQRQHGVVLVADHVAVPLQDHAVQGQRAGLVGAQHVHGAEVLDRVQALDDHLLAGHGDGAAGRHTETIIGSISGVRPTATARAKKKASIQSCFVRPLMRNTSGTITSMKRIISQVKRRHALVEAGLHVLADDALGHAAQVGLEARLDDHARGRAALDAGAEEADVLQLEDLPRAPFSLASNFSTGSDSPVRLDWITNRSLQETRRRSAGIMSPAARRTTSPGTRWPSGISRAWPSRTTVAVTLIMALSLAAALSARASWTNRSATPSTTMLNITVAARTSPVINEIVASTKQQDHQRIDAGVAQELEPAEPLFLRDDVGAVLFQAALGLLLAQAVFARLQPAEDPCGVALGQLRQQRRTVDRVRRAAQDIQDVLGQDEGRQDRHRGAPHARGRTNQAGHYRPPGPSGQPRVSGPSFIPR